MRCDNAVATFGVAFLVKGVAFWVKDTVAKGRRCRRGAAQAMVGFATRNRGVERQNRSKSDGK
jgi:hypothetical protein